MRISINDETFPPQRVKEWRFSLTSSFKTDCIFDVFKNQVGGVGMIFSYCWLFYCWIFTKYLYSIFINCQVFSEKRSNLLGITWFNIWFLYCEKSCSNKLWHLCWKKWRSPWNCGLRSMFGFLLFRFFSLSATLLLLIEFSINNLWWSFMCIQCLESSPTNKNLTLKKVFKYCASWVFNYIILNSPKYIYNPFNVF